MHKFFQFCRVVGYALATQETASVLGDQHIVLDAYATKVLVGFQLVEDKELLAVSAGLPLVNQSGDEIDARLVSDNKTFLQLASHAQAISAKLFQVGARLIVETYIDLSQTFHVVNIHTHHVT